MHDIHPLDDLPKNDMLVVQKRRRDRTDEELTPVGVGTGILKIIVSKPNHKKTLPSTTRPPQEKQQHTAILKTPSASCLNVKFSSANLLVP